MTKSVYLFKLKSLKMQWYQYVSGFWAGAFLANFVPHFIKGVSGDPFPTPFSKPPGKGLSSPIVNVWWALLNVLVGYLLFRVGKVSPDDMLSLIVFFLGAAGISLLSARNFVNKDKV
jgi:hypothetical protein